MTPRSARARPADARPASVRRACKRCARGLAITGVAITLAAFPAPASRAGAHGTAGQAPANFDSTVSRIEPAEAGVRVRTTDLGQHLEVRADVGVDVVVLGYDAEPYLRITDSGVERNERSPAVFMNRDTTVTETPPEQFDASASPQWHRISSGRVARWHDHRIHPSGALGQHEQQHGFAWTVDLIVAGRPVAVHGRTRSLAPPPVALWLLLIAAIAALTGFAASRSRAATLAIFGSLVLAAVIAIPIGRAGASTETLAARVQTALWPTVAAVVLGGALAHLARRGLHRAAPSLLFGFTATAIAVGLASLPWLTHARLPASGPAWLWRVVVAFVLGASSVAVIVCSFALRGSERPADCADQRDPASAAIRRRM